MSIIETLERVGDELLGSKDPIEVLDGRDLRSLASDLRHGLMVYKTELKATAELEDLMVECDSLESDVETLRRKIEDLQEQQGERV